jgi:hypothetical protein
MIDHSLAAELRASFTDDDTLNLTLPDLPMDNPLYQFDLNKVTAGNKLPVKVLQDEFHAAILGQVEIVDETTGQLVEKKFATVPAPPRQLSKPAALTKTAQGAEFFDDLWIARAYKAVNSEYRACGDTGKAMQQALDLFSDQLSASESALLRTAVEKLDLTKFLQMFAVVLRRGAV